MMKSVAEISYAMQFAWFWQQDPDDAWIGFVDSDGDRLVLLMGVSEEDGKHIVELHNAWLKRN